jgi:hypothetical protein
MLRQMDPEFNLVFWKFRRVDETVRTGDVLKEEDSIYMEYDRQVTLASFFWFYLVVIVFIFAC